MRSNVFDTIRALLFTLLVIAYCSMFSVEAGTQRNIIIEEPPAEEVQEADPEPIFYPVELITLEATQVHVVKKSPAEPSVEAPAPAKQPEATWQAEPQTEPPAEDPEPQWISYGTYTLTAYCACETCCNEWATNRPLDENGNPIIYTASGARAEAGTTIAVDPNVIPYGTKVKINDHIYTAQDTGGAIKGNCIDVYFSSHAEACAFEKQWAEVFIMQEG